MSTFDPRWDKSGWLPALTVISWPRLETLRKRHEAAVTARNADPASADKLSALCEVVERACEDLDRYWSEVEKLCAAEEETVRGAEAEADQIALRGLLRSLSPRVLDGTHILPGAVYESRKALSKLGAAA